jgi:hypothetical protein
MGSFMIENEVEDNEWIYNRFFRISKK